VASELKSLPERVYKVERTRGLLGGMSANQLPIFV